MPSPDSVEGDSTESFVEISEYEGVAQEKDKPPPQSDQEYECQDPIHVQELPQEGKPPPEDVQTPDGEAETLVSNLGEVNDDPKKVTSWTGQQEQCDREEHRKYQETKAKCQPDEHEITKETQEVYENPEETCETDQKEEPERCPNHQQEGMEKTQTMYEEHENTEVATCERDQEEDSEEHNGAQDSQTERELHQQEDCSSETQTVSGEQKSIEETCEGDQKAEPAAHPVAPSKRQPDQLHEDKEGSRDSLYNKDNPREVSYGEEHAPEENVEVYQEATEKPEETQYEQETDTWRNVIYNASTVPCSMPRPDGNQEEEEEQSGEEKQTPHEYEEPSRLMESSVRPLAPAESLWTVTGDGAVTLRMEEPGPAAASPTTVPQLFSHAVAQYGQKMALCVRRADGWEGATYTQYEERSRAVAKGLLKVNYKCQNASTAIGVLVLVVLKAMAYLNTMGTMELAGNCRALFSIPAVSPFLRQLGLERFHAVLIIGFNSPEWFMAEIGAILAGGLAVGVDPFSTGSFCLKVALECQAQIIVVQGLYQLRKILQVRERLPQLKAIIQWAGRGEDPFPGTYTWGQLMDLSSEVDESYLDEVMESQRPNQCCAVMYPSGGAGEPRGVMLSHDNVTWTSGAIGAMLGLGPAEVVVSYLPLCHMSVQLFDLWLPLCCGGTTYFAEPDAQKGSLLSTLQAVRPTRFLGFPGFWEKVSDRWMMLENEATFLQRKVLGWAREKGLLSCRRPSSALWGFALADRLVFRPARLALGLDRCTHCYVGIAPVSLDVVEYFGSLGIELLELYGMNESSGVYSLALPVSGRRGRNRCEDRPIGSTMCRLPTAHVPASETSRHTCCKGRWSIVDGARAGQRAGNSVLEVTGSRIRGSPSHVQEGAALCLWGHHIFMGYIGMEQATRDVLDEDGWFITGVLGRREEDGFLHIGERDRGSRPGWKVEMRTSEENVGALYMEI